MRREKTEMQASQIYLKQIEKFPVLSREEEVSCARLAAKGDAAAKEKLIVSNLRFVVSIAAKYRNLGLPLIDLINEGNIGLIRAAKKFDAGKGYRFISYARWWVRHYILKAIFEQSTSIRVPLKYAPKLSKLDEIDNTEIGRNLKQVYRPASLDQTLSEGDNSDTILDLVEGAAYEQPEKLALEQNLKMIINEALGKLKPMEQEVMSRHYGLNGKSLLTLKEIGKKYNLTKERIRQIEQAAIGKLKHTMQKKEVMEFISK